MKKKLALILAITMLVTMLAGCSQKQAQEPVTITVWTYYNGAAKDTMDKMVYEFNKTIGQEQNIVVDAYTQGDVNQLADAVFAAANKDVGAGPMPNIFSAYSDSALRIDEMGLVANLDKYFTEEELAQYRAEFIESGRFGADNGLKIMPIAKSSENIFLNKTYFDKFAEQEKSTIDLTTWEGMAAAAKAYYNWTDGQTAQPNDGKALFGIDSMANFMIVAARQLGCEIYDIKGSDVTVNMPENVAKKIWDNFYVPFVSGYYAAIGRFRSDDAKMGDVLAYAGSTAGAVYFPIQIESGKDAAYPIECTVLPYPHFADGEQFVIEQGAGMAISKSDEAHEKASAVFLKWFSAKEQNLQFTAKTGYLPVKNESLSLDEFKKVAVAEENKNIIAAAETTFKMLETCGLYGTKPFAKSYDARKVLESSLLNYAKDDLTKINAETAETGDREGAIAKFVTQANFENWYRQFLAEMTGAVKK